MTEAEQLDLFEKNVRRFQLDKNQSDLMSCISPVADDYYSAAQNLGAELLLLMVEAYRERPALLGRIEALKDQLEEKTHEAAAMAALHERAEAESARRRSSRSVSAVAFSLEQAKLKFFMDKSQCGVIVCVDVPRAQCCVNCEQAAAFFSFKECDNGAA